MLRRYLIVCALSFSAVLMVTAVTVVVVDPYGVFGLVNQEGFNSRKVRLTHSQFEVRSRVAARLKADAWILGNSRAEMGFDPMHPAFSQNGLAKNDSESDSAFGGQKKYAHLRPNHSKTT